jgi:histidine triad (HIT) family protein
MIHDCLGCRLANKLEPTHIVFENDLITCILDIAPLNEGHVLILPKKHYLDVDDLDIETANAIMAAAACISKALKMVFKPDGISIFQNGGKFNDLGHYHMHIFPRYEGDGFAWVEPKDVTDAKNRLSETKRMIIRFIN